MGLAECLVSILARNLSLSSKQDVIFSKVGGWASDLRQEASRGPVLSPQLRALVSFKSGLTSQSLLLLIYMKVYDKNIMQLYHVSMWAALRDSLICKYWVPKGHPDQGFLCHCMFVTNKCSQFNSSLWLTHLFHSWFFSFLVCVGGV